MAPTRCWRAVSLALALALLGSAPAVRARSLEDQARVLFREGNARFASGDYQGALERFRKAKALHPSYKIDLNIGTTLNALGRHTEAAEHYDLFLRRADRVAPRDLVKEVALSLDDLRRKLGSVEVACVVPGARVEVDGQEAGITPLGRPIYLEPGNHKIVVRKLGHEAHEVTLGFAAGEHKRLTVPWRPDKTLRSPPLPLPAVVVVSEKVEHFPLDDSAERRRSKTVWAYSALGVAGACVIGAGVMYGVGTSQASSAHDKYLAATEPVEVERYRNDVESSKKLWIGGHVLIGLGAVALGVSIYQLATRPAAEVRALSAGRPRVGLAPAPGGGVVSVSGGF